MANQEQLAILKQGVEVWNRWRAKHPNVRIDLYEAQFIEADLTGADLSHAFLSGSNFFTSNLTEVDFNRAILGAVVQQGPPIRYIPGAHVIASNLQGARFSNTELADVVFDVVNLSDTDFSNADLVKTLFRTATLGETKFSLSRLHRTTFDDVDLSKAIGLWETSHIGPSTIGTSTIALSKGQIPDIFLRGCGLGDWEIESVKLYNPDLSNEEINNIQYRVYDLRATQALQISPLFLSYSHADSEFVDKVGESLNEKGVRYWRDIHDMKAGRIEKQIDRAIRQNPTVLLVLSEHSLSSDWVEHEVRTARTLEKEMGRDALCPVALDDSWKSSRWPKRLMEQIMEYNIMDFSAWRDDGKFDGMFRRLIDGLELFYKGESHGE
jgi:uncharacterized protein YjbI with pentapeptide repeats